MSDRLGQPAPKRVPHRALRWAPGGGAVAAEGGDLPAQCPQSLQPRGPTAQALIPPAVGGALGREPGRLLEHSRPLAVGGQALADEVGGTAQQQRLGPGVDVVDRDVVALTGRSDLLHRGVDLGGLSTRPVVVHVVYGHGRVAPELQLLGDDLRGQWAAAQDLHRSIAKQDTGDAARRGLPELGDLRVRELGEPLPGDLAGPQTRERVDQVIALAFLAGSGHHCERRSRKTAQQRHEPVQRPGDVLLLAQHRQDDVEPQPRRLRSGRAERGRGLVVGPGKGPAQLPQAVGLMHGRSCHEPPGQAPPPRAFRGGRHSRPALPPRPGSPGTASSAARPGSRRSTACRGRRSE